MFPNMTCCLQYSQKQCVSLLVIFESAYKLQSILTVVINILRNICTDASVNDPRMVLNQALPCIDGMIHGRI